MTFLKPLVAPLARPIARPLAGLALVTLGLGAALPASAADVAMILGNGDYDTLPDLRAGEDPVDAAAALRRAGVTVLSGKDVTLDKMQGLGAQFAQMASEADGVVVILSGRFITSGQDTYFLPVDSEGPSLFEAPAKALPLSVLLAVLHQAPGPALLGLATDSSGGRPGPYLTRGIGTFEPPEDVAVVTGTPRALARLAQEGLTSSGRSLARAVRDSRELTALNDLPDTAPFLKGGSAPAASEEETRWAVADELDTVDGYKLYLDRYPSGRHAGEARDRIDFLQGAPGRQAEASEEALNLSRDQRREIQRDLQILGYDTRGIDGIFGPGTRSAITSFQKAQGYDQTSYLTRPQIGTLDDLAARRAAELRREAEARRKEQEAKDNEYWQRIGGADANAESLRAYLDRYKDGLHADAAKQALQDREAEARSRTAAEERRAWDRARQADSVAAYRSYLSEYPKGSFRFEAESRIEDLNGAAAQRQADEAAQAQENALGLNPVTRRIVEERLEAQGLNPGPVDGSFDENTRRALRRYQQQSGIEVSGYLNEPTVVRLLADSVRSILK